MYRPRATKNEMTFERADRMAANKQKKLIEFFAACQERLFYYGICYWCFNNIDGISLYILFN